MQNRIGGICEHFVFVSLCFFQRSDFSPAKECRTSGKFDALCKTHNADNIWFVAQASERQRNVQWTILYQYTDSFLCRFFFSSSLANLNRLRCHHFLHIRLTNDQMYLCVSSNCSQRTIWNNPNGNYVRMIKVIIYRRCDSDSFFFLAAAILLRLCFSWWRKKRLLQPASVHFLTLNGHIGISDVRCEYRFSFFFWFFFCFAWASPHHIFAKYMYTYYSPINMSWTLEILNMLLLLLLKNTFSLNIFRKKSLLWMLFAFSDMMLSIRAKKEKQQQMGWYCEVAIAVWIFDCDANIKWWNFTYVIRFLFHSIWELPDDRESETSEPR